MSRFNAAASRAKVHWAEAKALHDSLISDGWVSPDTYSTFYAPIENIPAVYLFMVHGPDGYDSALIAYVGMSTNLRQRMSGHEIHAMIDQPRYWTMRWFKEVKRENLRATEGEYIAKFDPPWNIVGRSRGVILA